MIKKLELDEERHKELIAYCCEKDIMFLSTPFDIEEKNLTKCRLLASMRVERIRGECGMRRMYVCM